ncbi:putative histone transcription regulator [Suhomyces tanzawaensis NRRL Y-17324]|uniref:Protein HIR n=1 Tax=Suhomyces tanzawaensis NRRL Y-17324 TaxID=984487 RepID=A0A1E4SJI6_9ASCO|nr:putative histone transcription regulator [Suhomyces tanzawaensis NRRL Y-17324]ODV79664.1 putative histone transcription regulator [Suhomyces tanzawaensis NRRL Y-17324]
MHILKLPWFGHRTENKKIECYSVTINADGTRLASGGLDGNVKIWDTNTILQFGALSKEQGQPSPKKKKTDPTIEDINLPDVSLRRPLCSMSRHNGVVTSVKFSPDGRFLASGSDDKICLIWEKEEELLGQKQFGEAEADLEHWTVRKRLVAHDNDIQDICWSPDGLLLVTVGLDRLIIIWNGLTFERIKRYDIHQSMVKGIVFDPANKFFATASDDRTVRIFRYYKKLNETTSYEFQMEHIVVEPFRKSPLTSYFRRMSWSPDGQHIAVPNATNGPVSSVAVINRGNWAADVSLIGHEAPCEICAFSPRLFELGGTGKKSKDKTNFTTVLATGGQDRTLAVWSTANSRPLVVAQDIVDNSITDMCWSPDGQTLYFCCLDGSITCVMFEANELGEVVSEDIIDTQLHKYGGDREAAIFPESVEQLILEDKSGLEDNLISRRTTKPVSLDDRKKLPIGEETTLEMPKVNNLTPKQLTKMTQSVTIKNGKKRVAPLLVQASTKKESIPTSVISNKFRKVQVSNKLSQPSYLLPRLGVNSSVHGIKLKNVNNQHSINEESNMDQDNDNEDMGIDDSNTASLNQNTISEAALKRQRNKLKRSLMESKYPSCFKQISNLPESLFSNQSLLNSEISQLLNNLSNSKDIQPETTNLTSIDVDEDLLFSVIVHGVEHTQVSNPIISESNSSYKTITTIEVRNGQGWSVLEDELNQNESKDFNDATRVIISNNSKELARKYVLFFPYKIQHSLPVVLNGILKYFVLASFKGTIQIVSADTGRFLCPSFELGENILYLKHRSGFLLILTSSGLIYSWKLGCEQRGLKGVLNKVSIAPVLNCVEINSVLLQDGSSESKKAATILLPNLKAIDVNPKDGSPLVVLDSSGNLYNYSIDLGTWTKVIDSWYYLSVEEKELHDSRMTQPLEQLISKTYNEFIEDIKKSKINWYKFDAKSNDLKTVMRERFQEVLDLHL